MPAKKYLEKEIEFTLFRENSRKQQLGFTLIELLVVIAIISILAVLVFVSFIQIQKNTRDVQRKSDLQIVAGALQRFYSDNAHYPNGGNGDGYIKFNPTDCSYDVVSGFVPPAAGVIWGATTPEVGLLVNNFACNGHSYLKQLPTDPLNKTSFTSPYAYCYLTSNVNLPQNYQLFARMENSGNSNTSLTSCGTAINYYNYVVTSND